MRCLRVAERALAEARGGGDLKSEISEGIALVRQVLVLLRELLATPEVPSAGELAVG